MLTNYNVNGQEKKKTPPHFWHGGVFSYSFRLFRAERRINKNSRSSRASGKVENRKKAQRDKFLRAFRWWKETGRKNGKERGGWSLNFLVDNPLVEREISVKNFGEKRFHQNSQITRGEFGEMWNVEKFYPKHSQRPVENKIRKNQQRNKKRLRWKEKALMVVGRGG